MKAVIVALAAPFALAAASPPPNLAEAFGARESVSHLSLSPDGGTVAYIAPRSGQGSALYTLSLASGSLPKLALVVTGTPERLERCKWVTSARLVCQVYGVTRTADELLPFTRLVAADAGGGNIKQLSMRENFYTRGLQLDGGEVLDWLPDENGAVLMTRVYLPDAHTGSRLGSDKQGLGVVRIDTSTLAIKPIEPPRPNAVEYISDGRGTVRIMGLRDVRGATGMDSGTIRYVYRLPGSRAWEELADYNYVSSDGFRPLAVDPDRNIAFGFRKKGGRQALFSVALDASKKETLLFERPEVDVDELIHIGRRDRVVGASYATDVRTPFFFDPEIKALTEKLSKALPGRPSVRIVDSSTDESKLLVFVSSDKDPGVYYIYDKSTRKLQTFLVARAELEGFALGEVRPIGYPASDGTTIPGYLTFPPGKENMKNLPAIVMPHGGPSARDEWGFDWLSQFYAARGYVVIQPNFRGSSGYGDSWLGQNAFRSWRAAIGDVLDAGRWLIKQGIADPAKLGIVGWSYGGYAALQSAVVDPGLFKAVVAIAPVTDLNRLKDESRGWSDHYITSEFIGADQTREGSPAQNADKIKTPVLLFHGTMDRNVKIGQSRLMDSRLAAAQVPHELVTLEGLDHYLEDSAARTTLLSKSDEFLRSATMR